MLADQLDYVVGVDPHRDSHALAVVQIVSGAVVFETTVAANSDGYAVVFGLTCLPLRRTFTARTPRADPGAPDYSSGVIPEL